MNRVLVVEDEDVIRRAVHRLLERNNYEVVTVKSVDEAIETSPRSFDLILADLRLPGAEGTDIIKEAGPVPVIIMTSHASVRSAVESMKLGAIDYVSKPFDHDELLLVMGRALRHNQLSAQNMAMKHDLRRIFPFDEIVSNSVKMHSIISQISSLDDSQRHVFLHGERGTGKELLARLAHESGERSTAPLVFADLPMFDQDELSNLLLGGEFSEDSGNNKARIGLTQTAHNGTLVIRNIDYLPKELQLKFSDMLKRNSSTISPLELNSRQRQVNIRVIALNLVSLNEAIERDLLLPELKALFENACFEVPPLRTRREDLPSMAKHFLETYTSRYRKRQLDFSVDAMHAIGACNWYGNVNELKSAIERAVLLCDSDEISPRHLGLGYLGDNAVGSNGQTLSLDAYFRYFVQSHQENMSETDLAQRLGISRKALWERRQKMGLPRP